jgi:hypothetical protein
MTETIAINITKIKDGRELPAPDKLRCYSLDREETIETAIEKFEKYYRRSPERGSIWGWYLFLGEKP